MLHMCVDVGGVCEEVTDQKTILALSHSSGKGDTFAEPIVTYGDLQLSQGIAATIFIGETLGFDVPETRKPKAMQYMLDLRDFIDNSWLAALTVLSGGDKSLYPVLGGNATAVQRRFDAYAESGRLKEFVDHFERSIIGPYYFGSSPSYVDYYFVSVINWMAHRLGCANLQAPRCAAIGNAPKLATIMRSRVAQTAAAGYGLGYALSSES